MRAIQPPELALWHRVGRGRSSEFDVSDEDIAQCVAEALLPERAPYTVVAADRVQIGRFYSWSAATFPPDELRRYWSDREAPWRSLWVWSLELTPDLALRPGANIDALCSLNGLVLLQPRLKTMLPRIAVSPRVANQHTQEIRTYDDYVRIFDALRRCIKTKCRG